MNNKSRQVRPFRRIVALLTLLIVSGLISVSCRNDLSQVEQPTKVQASCHIVEHIMGKTCVPDHPQRIITLWTPPLASMLAVGIKPIGIAPVTGVPDEFPSYLTNEVKDIEIIVSVNQEPDLEKILELKPDLILGWNFNSAIYPTLSKIAPTLLNEPNSDTTVWSDWQSYFKFVSKAVGKEAEAEDFLKRYRQKVLQLKADLENNYDSKTISIAQISDKYGIETYVKNSFPGSIMSSLGLERPESQDKTIQPRGTVEAISTERIDLIDGEVLFVLTFHENDSEMLENLLDSPLWRKLEAVQQEQIYFVDGWTWVVPNCLSAEAVLEDIRKYLVESS